MRWMTWLKAVKIFLNALKNNTERVSTAKKIIDEENLSEELYSISDFSFLIEANKKLQIESLRLDDAADLIKSVGLNLDSRKQ